MIKIFTDSTSDLTAALVTQHDVEVIPLNVHVGGRSFRDSFDFTPTDLFALVETHGELPKTSAPSVGDFLTHFRREMPGVYVGISSQLSASVRNAQAAAQLLSNGHVRVIDTHTLSSGVGMLALLAADLRDAGHDVDEIERRVRAAASRVRVSFVIDTMDYLYKGGRCTALQHLVGSLLKIRPVIYVRPDGRLDVRAKVRGSRQRALHALVEDFEAHLPTLDRRRVFITHSAYSEGAGQLRAALTALAPDAEISVTEAGAVVSSHCGPKTIGVIYMSEPT
ncbi:MAG: DegV family protein [Anaerolineae bacterium]